MVISDYFGNYGYMDADKAICGGTTGNEAILTDRSATSVIAMRQATKDVLYTTINSAAYESYVPGTLPRWQKILYDADAAVAVVLVLWEIFLVRRYQKQTKTPAKAEN